MQRKEKSYWPHARCSHVMFGEHKSFSWTSTISSANKNGALYYGKQTIGGGVVLLFICRRHNKARQELLIPLQSWGEKKSIILMRKSISEEILFLYCFSISASVGYLARADTSNHMESHHLGIPSLISIHTMICAWAVESGWKQEAADVRPNTMASPGTGWKRVYHLSIT